MREEAEEKYGGGGGKGERQLRGKKKKERGEKMGERGRRRTGNLWKNKGCEEKGRREGGGN